MPLVRLMLKSLPVHYREKNMNEKQRKIRLLLIEDNPGDVVLLRHIVESYDLYDIVEAGSLHEAKTAVAQQGFDVALLDLTLPDSDGLETVEELHAAAPRLPIVVMTGVTDENVATAAVRRGAEDYLVKGKIDDVLVSRTIGYAIDRKHAAEALQEAHDDLERRVQERTADLQCANRTLRMISECNQALVRIADEEQLAGEVCRIIEGIGGYRLASVSYAEDVSIHRLRHIAITGGNRDDRNDSEMTWTDMAKRLNATTAAIRSGQVRIDTNILKDPELARWQERAAEDGIRCAIALPLAGAGHVFGALTIFATTPDAFDSSQTTMLQGLADDLAFGIAALRAQEERDRAEQALAHRAEQLRALATELTQMEQRERKRLARILHDNLQQLLVCAKLNLGFVRAKAKVKSLQDAIDQTSDTINEAIQASRVLTAELSPPILHEKGLTRGLEWLGRHMHEKHGLLVEIKADQEAEPISEHVRGFLYEAVRELLFNVVKHAGVHRAQVLVSRNANEILIEVADEGVGFNPDSLEEKTGTVGCFGLFSLRERLSFLGGQIAMISAPGRGSRFTLVVPLFDHEEKQTIPSVVSGPSKEGQILYSQPAHPPTAGRRIHVILADDHPVIRQGLARLLLEQPDIEVVGEAADGQAAVEMARQLRPDVIIMDVSMPRMNGFDATRLIAKECQGTRVIGLSMHEEAQIKTSMLEAGAVAYFTKDGPIEDLIAAIRNQ